MGKAAIRAIFAGNWRARASQGCTTQKWSTADPHQSRDRGSVKYSYPNPTRDRERA